VSLAYRSRLGCIAALVVAAIGCSAPAASAAALNGRQIGTAGTIVGTDGLRFAAWRPVMGNATRVFDASDGHTLVIGDPAGCRAPVIGAGALLFTCAVSQPGAAAGAYIGEACTGPGRTAPRRRVGSSTAIASCYAVTSTLNSYLGFPVAGTRGRLAGIVLQAVEDRNGVYALVAPPNAPNEGPRCTPCTIQRVPTPRLQPIRRKPASPFI
jgi:hypothetical protein